MFAAVDHPETLPPEELDAYLQRGWFRMGPTIFTTNFLSFKDQLYSAIWLRVLLEQYTGERKQAHLYKQNSIFRTELHQANITPEKEALFATYKKSVLFEASASLQHLLFGKSERTAFDTYEFNVYDKSKLIAVGYFDLGATAGMGITSFYDPSYKKYSLGKYLIYLKMEHCKNQGMKYFYPGYFVPGYSFFDYKLTMAKSALEYLQLETSRWYPIGTFTTSMVPVQVMHDKLAKLQDSLLLNSLPCSLMRYEFFDANLIPDLAGANLFDFPLFIFLPGSIQESTNQFIVFDILDQRYHLIRCRGIWKTNSKSASDIIYSAYVLRQEALLFSTPNIDEIVEMINTDRKQLIPKTGTK